MVFQLCPNLWYHKYRLPSQENFNFNYCKILTANWQFRYVQCPTKTNLSGMKFSDPDWISIRHWTLSWVVINEFKLVIGPPWPANTNKISTYRFSNENHSKSVLTSFSRPQILIEHRFQIGPADLICKSCWKCSGVLFGLTKPAIWQYCRWH